MLQKAAMLSKDLNQHHNECVINLIPVEFMHTKGVQLGCSLGHAFMIFASSFIPVLPPGLLCLGAELNIHSLCDLIQLSLQPTVTLLFKRCNTAEM